jgi:hypothetical protein
MLLQDFRYCVKKRPCWCSRCQDCSGPFRLSIKQAAKSGSNDAQAPCGDVFYLFLENSPGNCGFGPGAAM